jgi:UDP-galactopyranose mutase
MISADYIVVGSGLSGATIGRHLADVGREVIVLERRPHVGGNVHETLHESGISVHTYGPHYFRTGSERIWSFVTRFSPFRTYEPELLTYVDGQYQHWPIQANYLDQLIGRNWTPEFSGTPQNFEEAALHLMPSIVYEKFIKGYTEKQWGVFAHTLQPELARRFEVRHNNDRRLSLHKYQGLPTVGYLDWMLRMLADIPVFLNTDYLQTRDSFQAKKLLIFTGPIDEYCSFKRGRLKYRGQKRVHTFHTDVGFRLPGIQVNYPDQADGEKIRTIEWKHLMMPDTARNIIGTLTTDEVPYSPSDPNNYEYPCPDEHNQDLYQRYRQDVSTMKNILICGRLGEYRYYDMDQAIGRGMKLFDQILSSELG